MDKFSKEVTLDPKEIPNMNMSQKQDCMAEIDKIRKTAWVYSWIFCLGVIAFIFIYSLIQMIYTLKYRGLLENINPFLILIPVAVFIPSIFAHMMNGKCIIWAYLTYLAAGLFTISQARCSMRGSHFLPLRERCFMCGFQGYATAMRHWKRRRVSPNSAR